MFARVLNAPLYYYSKYNIYVTLGNCKYVYMLTKPALKYVLHFLATKTFLRYYLYKFDSTNIQNMHIIIYTSLLLDE